MTWKIPKKIETIRHRIEEYEKYLLYEKRRFGDYDDSGGIRYVIGPYYMLAGDMNGALKHYKWFKRVFSDDCGEPAQYICWTLAVYKSGDLKKAYIKFLQTLFMNPHVIARLIGIDYVLPYKPNWNIPTKGYADWITDEIYNLWNEEAKNWLKESFNNPKTQELFTRYNELEIQLDNEPEGPKRSRIVNELSAILRIEKI